MLSPVVRTVTYVGLRGYVFQNEIMMSFHVDRDDFKSCRWF